MSIEKDQDQQQPELSSKLSSSSSLSLSPDIRLARAMRKTGNYSNEKLAELLDYVNAAARKRKREAIATGVAGAEDISLEQIKNEILEEVKAERHDPQKNVIFAFYLNEIEKEGKHFARLVQRWRKNCPSDEKQLEAEYRTAEALEDKETYLCSDCFFHDAEDEEEGGGDK